MRVVVGIPGRDDDNRSLRKKRNTAALETLETRQASSESSGALTSHLMSFLPG